MRRTSVDKSKLTIEKSCVASPSLSKSLVSRNGSRQQVVKSFVASDVHPAGRSSHKREIPKSDSFASGAKENRQDVKAQLRDQLRRPPDFVEPPATHRREPRFNFVFIGAPIEFACGEVTLIADNHDSEREKYLTLIRTGRDAPLASSTENIPSRSIRPRNWNSIALPLHKLLSRYDAAASRPDALRPLFRLTF